MRLIFSADGTLCEDANGVYIELSAINPPIAWMEQGRYTITLETRNDETSKRFTSPTKTITFESEVVGYENSDKRWLAIPYEIQRGVYTVTLAQPKPKLLNCPFCGEQAYEAQLPGLPEAVTCHTDGCPLKNAWISPEAWNIRRG